MRVVISRDPYGRVNAKVYDDDGTPVDEFHGYPTTDAALAAVAREYPEYEEVPDEGDEDEEEGDDDSD